MIIRGRGRINHNPCNHHFHINSFTVRLFGNLRVRKKKRNSRLKAMEGKTDTHLSSHSNQKEILLGSIVGDLFRFDNQVKLVALWTV